MDLIEKSTNTSFASINKRNSLGQIYKDFNISFAHRACWRSGWSNRLLCLQSGTHYCCYTWTPYDHVSNTKGFSLRTLNYFILDEADRLLDEDFEKTLDDILKVIPR